MTITTEVNKASPDSFELIFPMIPRGESSDDLTTNEELILNIHSTVIPGISLDPTEESWQGSRTQTATGKMNYDQWSFQFMVDEQFNNWKLLFQWMKYINNSKTRYARNENLYKIDSSLRILDNFKEEIMRLRFISVWPVSLGEVSMSFRDAEISLECSATLIYDRIELETT